MSILKNKPKLRNFSTTNGETNNLVWLARTVEAIQIDGTGRICLKTGYCCPKKENFLTLKWLTKIIKNNLPIFLQKLILIEHNRYEEVDMGPAFYGAQNIEPVIFGHFWGDVLKGVTKEDEEENNLKFRNAVALKNCLLESVGEIFITFKFWWDQKIVNFEQGAYKNSRTIPNDQDYDTGCFRRLAALFYSLFHFEDEMYQFPDQKRKKSNYPGMFGLEDLIFIVKTLGLPTNSGNNSVRKKNPEAGSLFLINFYYFLLNPEGADTSKKEDLSNDFEVRHLHEKLVAELPELKYLPTALNQSYKNSSIILKVHNLYSSSNKEDDGKFHQNFMDFQLPIFQSKILEYKEPLFCNNPNLPSNVQAKHAKNRDEYATNKDKFIILKEEMETFIKSYMNKCGSKNSSQVAKKNKQRKLVSQGYDRFLKGMVDIIEKNKPEEIWHDDSFGPIFAFIRNMGCFIIDQIDPYQFYVFVEDQGGENKKFHDPSENDIKILKIVISGTFQALWDKLAKDRSFLCSRTHKCKESETNSREWFEETAVFEVLEYTCYKFKHITPITNKRIITETFDALVGHGDNNNNNLTSGYGLLSLETFNNKIFENNLGMFARFMGKKENPFGLKQKDRVNLLRLLHEFYCEKYFSMNSSKFDENKLGKEVMKGFKRKTCDNPVLGN